MNRTKYLIVVFLFATSWVSAQVKTYDFHPPLDIPLVLSANFGELRANHFHMGLDFKTNGVSGLKLYAIDDGFVSRIKASTYGYGQVIYIDHPNGLTSVYAHCSAFVGALDSLVRIIQRQEQNYEVELFPRKDELPVKKGQVIALSGNTGHSGGPHLHFEIRDTKTEHALNPLLYGFDLADTQAPDIRGIKIYGVTPEGYRYPGKEVQSTVVKSDSGYSVPNGVIDLPAHFISDQGGIGIAVDVVDRFDGANNACGLYGSRLLVQGDTIFGQDLDRVPFESTRFISAHKDFESFKKSHQHYHKSFRTEENDLPIYYEKETRGIIHLDPGDSIPIEYLAYDFKRNSSRLRFSIRVSEDPTLPSSGLNLGPTYLDPKKSFHFQTDAVEILCEAKTVYEPITVNERNLQSCLASGNIPVITPYTIKIKKPKDYDSKYYLEISGEGVGKRVLQGKQEGDVLVYESKYFGKFTLKRDTIPPVITPINTANATIKASQRTLRWKISDGGSGILDYDLFIDDTWVPLSHEHKDNSVTFVIPESLTGQHYVKLLVCDESGNVKAWEGNKFFQ